MRQRAIEAKLIKDLAEQYQIDPQTISDVVPPAKPEPQMPMPPIAPESPEDEDGEDDSGEEPEPDEPLEPSSENLEVKKKEAELGDCGTGAGGFKPGNTCAAGGGGKTSEISPKKEKYSNTGIAAYDKGFLGLKKGADVSKYGFVRTTVSTKNNDSREAFIAKDKSTTIIFDHQPIYYDERDDAVRYIPPHIAEGSAKHGNALTVEAIYVEPKFRGKGKGQEALNSLKKASDDLGVDLRVFPTEINPKSKFAEMLKADKKSLSGGPSTEQLTKWYKKNGFENLNPESDKVLVYKSKKKALEQIFNKLDSNSLKMLIAGMMGGIELGKYDGIDFTPPQGARGAAKRALDVREGKPASQKGMTPVGIARARDLMNGVKLSPDTVRRMKAFFDRHEVDKKGATWDEQGKGWQAWNGWGGDAKGITTSC